MSEALSFLGTVSGAARAVGTIAGSVGDAASAIGGLFGLPTNFFDLLQPASWRGVPFAVLGSKVQAGRRKALHEYPFRDGVWVEDLGKKGRVYAFEGFVVGENVGSQIKALVSAAEAAGPGELVHPTFGSTQCEILEFTGTEEWDAGCVWGFRAEFLEPVARGLQLLPASLQNTGSLVASAAADAQTAVTDGFLGQIASGVGQGVAAIQQAAAAVSPYVATATQLAGDASRIVGAVRGLSGNFGRYASGKAGAGTGSPLTSVAQVGVAVQGAIANATLARAAVSNAASSLSALIS